MCIHWHLIIAYCPGRCSQFHVSDGPDRPTMDVDMHNAKRPRHNVEWSLTILGRNGLVSLGDSPNTAPSDQDMTNEECTLQTIGH